MATTVTVGDSGGGVREVTYAEATGWIVDTDNNLDIRGNTGLIATYRDGFWYAVRKQDEK